MGCSLPCDQSLQRDWGSTRALRLCHTGSESWGQAGAGNAQPGPSACWLGWGGGTRERGGYPGALEEAEVGVERSRRAGSTVSFSHWGRRRPSPWPLPGQFPFPSPEHRPPLPAVHTTAYTHSESTQCRFSGPSPTLGARREIARLVGQWRWSLVPLHAGPSPPQGLPAPFPTTDTRLLARKLSPAAGLLSAPTSEGLGNERSQSRLPGGGSSLPPTSVLWVPGLHCLPRPKPPLPEVPQHHWPVGLLLLSQTSALLLLPPPPPHCPRPAPPCPLPSPSSCPFSSLRSPFLRVLPPPSPPSPVPPPRVIWQPDHFPGRLSRKPGHPSPPASVPTPSAGPDCSELSAI